MSNHPPHIDILVRLQGFDTRGMRCTVKAVDREFRRALNQNATQLEHARHTEDHIDAALAYLPKGHPAKEHLLKALEHVEAIKKEERMEDRYQKDVETQLRPMLPQMVSLFANVQALMEEVPNVR